MKESAVPATIFSPSAAAFVSLNSAPNLSETCCQLECFGIFFVLGILP